MGDQYINATGLVAIKNWIVSNFTNVIETVKVNGTAITPDANKAVDLTIPVLNTDNVGGFTLEDPETGHEVMFEPVQSDKTLFYYVDGLQSFDGLTLASTDYVDANGGKIDKIKRNGIEQTITNKTVDLNVPDYDIDSDAQSYMVIYGNQESGGGWSQYDLLRLDANNAGYQVSSDGLPTKVIVDKTYVDNTFRTETQVEQQIDDALADITGIDFQVVDTLPATGVKGTIYLVLNSGTSPNTYDEYIWVEPTGGTAHYEKIGTTDVDLSNYWTMTAGHANSLTAMTVAEIEAILAA